MTGARLLLVDDEDNLRTVEREIGVPYLHRTESGDLEDLTAGWEKFSTEAEKEALLEELAASRRTADALGKAFALLEEVSKSANPKK